MTDEDNLIEKVILWFNTIENTANRLTTGNVSHDKQAIRGIALRAIEYLKKIKSK